MQGVCRMVERRERCLVERLSPCLSPTLVGRLVGDYRAIWRWELEERYKETADEGRVDQLLASCRTLTSIEANRKPLIPLLDVVSLDNACGCQERYQVRTELGSCFERGQGLDWHTSALPYICSTYRSCLELYFPSCLSERDQAFILGEIRKEVRIKSDTVGFPRLPCLQSCISGDTAPCKTTTTTTTTTTTITTTTTTYIPPTTHRPTLQPQPTTSWPPCPHTSIRPTAAASTRPPCYQEVQRTTTQRPPCNIEEPPAEKTTERPSPRPTRVPPTRPTKRPIVRPTPRPTQRPIPTPTLRPTQPTPDCPCCQTTRPSKPPLPQTTQRPTPRPTDWPTEKPTEPPPCQRRR